MVYRKGVFILVYCIDKNKVNYLLLQRKLHWKGWEFPKGGVRLLETKLQAVKRELREETGLTPLRIDNLNHSGIYLYEKKFPDRRLFDGQTFSLYSVLVKKSEVILDKREHSDYAWKDFDQSMKLLKWSNQRESLKIFKKLLDEGKISVKNGNKN